jgi:dTDP-4-dehydrorhamnose reductase
MYGWNNAYERKNILTMTLEKLTNNEKVYAYEDVYSNPLYSVQCAQVIWKIIEMNLTGDFNVGGAETVTICDFLRTAAKVFGQNQELIVPVRQGYFSELVKRPRDTSLATNKIEDILGIKPLTLEQGLSMMKKSARAIPE